MSIEVLELSPEREKVSIMDVLKKDPNNAFSVDELAGILRIPRGTITSWLCRKFKQGVLGKGYVKGRAYYFLKQKKPNILEHEEPVW